MIHSTSNSAAGARAHSLISTPAPSIRTGTSASAGATDRLSLSSQTALREALAREPEIRPEVVAQGRDLADDPKYPPLQIIEALARVLVASPDLAEET